MGIFGAAHRWGGEGQKGPHPWNLSHIYYNDETWHSYTLPEEDPKNIWITWPTSWLLLTFFHRKSANFSISRNTGIDCILVQNFPESFKIILINLVIILIMSAKITTPGLLKITGFWNKGYDIIISIDDITNKILSRDSNYFADVFMWPQFGNWYFYERSYHNLNFIRIWPEKLCFLRGELPPPHHPE